MARKRVHEEVEASEPPQEQGLLSKLRNAWEFANLMQYIYIFGKAVKIDEDFDIEVHLLPLRRPPLYRDALSVKQIAVSRIMLIIITDLTSQDLENECLKPGPSEKLAEIGLCMLKFVSSHRGLTYVLQ